MRYKTSFVLLCLAWSAACADSDAPAETVDAAASTDSAPWSDAGTPRPDAGSPSSDANPSSSDASGTAGPLPAIVVLPDTQYYASAYPDIFLAQTRWIAAEQAKRNLQAVLHVGDVVDTVYSKPQWELAKRAFAPLDALIPYILVTGNHDLGWDYQGLLSTYFPPSTLPWITGTFEDGRLENSYSLLAIGDQSWLVVGLEFAPRKSVVAWASQVLRRFPDVPAILVTHAYLYSDGTRYDWDAKGATQVYNPREPGYGPPSPGDPVHDGEDLWQELVIPNPNLRMVFSGHINTPPYALAHRTDIRPLGGAPVHQFVMNFQSNTNGGDGFLVVLEFDYPQHRLLGHTLSATAGISLLDPSAEFVLDLVD